MIPYLIAGAIGFVVAKLFEEDEAPKYADGGSVLLAPNGKASKLTPEQYELVRTPEFKAWFGDWENSPETASKVVDENGEPLVLNHSTTRWRKEDGNYEDYLNLDSWQEDNGNYKFSTPKSSVNPIFLSRKGVYAFEDGAWQIKFFANIKNLFDTDNKNDLQKLQDYTIKTYGKYGDYNEMVQDLYGGGYETFEVDYKIGERRNKFENSGSIPALISEMGYGAYINYNENVIVVFDRNNLKLADGTNTTFDSNNPDIRFDEGGKIRGIDIDVDAIRVSDEIGYFDDFIFNELEEDEILEGFVIKYYYTKEIGLVNVQDDKFELGVGYIWGLQVFEEYKGKGFGKKIMEKIFILHPTQYAFRGTATKKSKGFWLNLGAEFDESDEYSFILSKDKLNYSDGGSVLLAPNGKPSKLTPEQYKLVRTPEFKAWFGDWENEPENASKVVDENGEPLMVFHGTNSDFNVFDETYIGSSNDRGFYGKGFYFTFKTNFEDIKYAINEASYYGGKILICYIKALNPFNLSILKIYKNKKINFIGANSLVFLYNIATLFPQISDKIFIEKKTWDKFTDEYDVEEVSISILPNLINKYANDLKLIETDGQFDEKETMGYVKSEIVKYDHTDNGGNKGEYTSYDDLGRVSSKLSKEEKEILFIELAIEKYDGISMTLYPEGYMTRNSIITDAIKKDHDCIMQGETGDELVVFQPTQIKLADGTNTTFDGNNPDIRYAGGGNVLGYNDVIKKQQIDNPYSDVLFSNKNSKFIEETIDIKELRELNGFSDDEDEIEQTISYFNDNGMDEDYYVSKKLMNKIVDGVKLSPIVVDENYKVLDGSHRLSAYSELYYYYSYDYPFDGILKIYKRIYN